MGEGGLAVLGATRRHTVCSLRRPGRPKAAAPLGPGGALSSRPQLQTPLAPPVFLLPPLPAPHRHPDPSLASYRTCSFLRSPLSAESFSSSHCGSCRCPSLPAECVPPAAHGVSAAVHPRQRAGRCVGAPPPGPWLGLCQGPPVPASTPPTGSTGLPRGPQPHPRTPGDGPEHTSACSVPRFPHQMLGRAETVWGTRGVLQGPGRGGAELSPVIYGQTSCGVCCLLQLREEAEEGARGFRAAGMWEEGRGRPWSRRLRPHLKSGSGQPSPQDEPLPGWRPPCALTLTLSGLGRLDSGRPVNAQGLPPSRRPLCAPRAHLGPVAPEPPAKPSPIRQAPWGLAEGGDPEAPGPWPPPLGQEGSP